MGTDFIPFAMTDTEAAEYLTLVDGVPAWLRPGLIDWCMDELTQHGRASVDVKLLHTANSMLRYLAIQTGPHRSNTTLRSDLAQMTPTQLLRFVDWLLSVTPEDSDTIEDLHFTLEEAGSKYDVGTRRGNLGLVNRVAEGVQDAAEALIAQGGTPGKLLADAWQKVHRLDPDDSGAYADAVRAVEVASFDALGIDNSKGNARLGQVIVMIRKDETWRPPFEREHPHHPVNQTLVGMLRTLWVGHRDRHGKADYTNVTHAEAEAAVTLAVTLVGWFTSGAVQQRPQPEQFDG